ncbi:MAG: ATP-binding protein [Deltaproteobacteria bacterium]|jgi:DNA replication protein DnaC|nr:ATP-binding protein [Deltaproteobacteria bacterium]
MDNEFLKLALDAFRNSDFSNVRPTDSVWHPPVWDVEEINQEARRVIDNHVLIEANKARQPFDINRAKDKHLGLPLVGPAGAGKTHILSYVNKRTMAEKGYFVSVNVETLTDFWQTLGSSYLSAFEKPGFDSRPQKVIVAEKIIRAAGLMEPQDVEAFFEKADQRAILDLAFKVSQALFQKKITRGQQPIVNDLIKVLFYLNANDSVMYNNAMLWLQGEMRDDEDFKALELKTLYKDKAEILKALNWLMSLGQSFTVTAFDQLDNILSPHVLGLPESQIFNSEKLKLEYDEAKRILVDLSRNLEIWINSAVSTLSVLAALADGWEKMSYHGTKTSTDRFNSQTFLHPGISGEIGRLLVERRLQEVYKNVPISPPYPSFPFPSKGFDGIVGYTPRDVLKMVELFISKCLEKGQLYECPLSEMKLSEKQGASGPGPEPEPEPEPMPEEIKKIDSRFRTLAAETWQVSNDEFGLYLLALGEALVRGFGRPDHLDLGEDTAPANRKEDNNTIILRYASDPLAPPDRILRMAFIDAEKYQTFQANLKWAVSQSGINPNLSSRKLGLIRFKDFPKGKASQDMLADCQQKGGKWLKPGPKDLAIMAALVTVEEEFSKGVFDEWLRYVHPAMLVEFSKPFFDWLITDDNATDGGSNKPGSSGRNGGHDSQESGSKDRQSEITAQGIGKPPDGGSGAKISGQGTGKPPYGDSGAKKQSIEPMVIGRYLNRKDELFTLEPERLLRHLAVFGSSGSGKTVLIKRLVEEAAILGASSVVIDLSGDLSCLGQRWP